MTGGARERRSRPSRADPRPRGGRDSAGARADGWVVGAKSVLRALAEPAVPSVVLVARDAPEHVVAPVLEQARARSVPVREADSALQLGAICGVSRPVATAVPPLPAT